MPSSVRSIFAAVGLEPGASVPWGVKTPAPRSGPRTGVYVVASTGDIDETDGAQPTFPASLDALDELLSQRPELLLDGERPDAHSLAERLSGFWLPNEPILYIGLAGRRVKRPPEGELAKRVGEYYKTKLGARSPHAGGWFLKTLSVLDDLVVHCAYCDHVDRVEQAMLESFASGVAMEAKDGLHDPERVMPFGNLEHPPGVRKRHGITGAKAPARSRSQDHPPAVPRASDEPTPTRAMTSHDVTPGAALTQNITAGDLTSGIIRVPKATKRVFPDEKGEVQVELRGEDIGERAWDPRTGLDRERSGVLRIGRAASRGLEVGERIVVERTDDGVRLT